MKTLKFTVRGVGCEIVQDQVGDVKICFEDGADYLFLKEEKEQIAQLGFFTEAPFCEVEDLGELVK